MNRKTLEDRYTAASMEALRLITRFVTRCRTFLLLILTASLGAIWPISIGSSAG